MKYTIKLDLEIDSDEILSEDAIEVGLLEIFGQTLISVDNIKLLEVND